MADNTIKVACIKCHGAGWFQAFNHFKAGACFACQGTGSQKEIAGARPARVGTVVAVESGGTVKKFVAISDRGVEIHNFTEIDGYSSENCSTIHYQPVGMARWIFKGLLEKGFRVVDRRLDGTAWSEIPHNIRRR